MNDDDKMVRWRGYAREQRSTVNSHFLAYAAALLGAESSVLLSRETLRVGWAFCFCMAGLAAAASFVGGSLVVLLRLREARLVARASRLRKEEKPDPHVLQLKESAERLKRWIGRLISAQVVGFSIAAVVFLVWVVGSTWGKLVATG